MVSFTPLNFYKLNTAVAFALALLSFAPSPAHATLNIPITVNLSESVNVTGTPQIAVDVGGTTRYATYTSGTGTNALTFTLSPQAGDVDLDGVTVSSPIQLNGGTIKDTKGNNATLTFTPPNTANVKVNYPSLGMDFVYDADGRYTLNGTPYNDLSSFLTAAGGSFTRASIGTYFDSSGNLQTAASGVPRFDYDPVTHTAKGILIEESRTNSVANASMTGAVAGVIGSGGVMPTNWNRSTCAGLSYQVIGTGNVSNLPYLDMRVYGTNTSGATCFGHIYMQYTVVPVNPGEKWALSAYTQLISGTHNAATMGNLNLGFQEFSSAGAYLTGTTGGSTISSTLTKQTIVATVNNASTTQARMMMNFAITNGTALDITVRIAAPQLEKGAFVTSFIPTSTGAVTRAADDLIIPTGSWLNASSGTLFGESLAYNATATVMNAASPTIASINMTGSNLARIGRYTANTGFFQSQTAGVTFFSLGTWNNATSQKIAGSYDSNGFSAILGTNTLNTSGAASLAGTLSQLRIGQYGSSGYWSSTIAKVKYYPSRVTNTQLQLMTQ